MSFYRSLIATLAAAMIALPVYAADEIPVNAAPSADATANLPADTHAITTTTVTTDQQTKVNLNKATVKELMKVKGLNASKARSIVSYRKKHGDFKSTEDLKNVKGFKKMKPDALKNITDQVGIE